MLYETGESEIVTSKASRSSGIEKHPVGSPQPHDELHLCATSWACGDKRCRVCDVSRLEKGVVLPCDHQPNGIGGDGTACMHKAEVSDFHEAIWQDMLEEPTDKLKHVEGGGTLSNASRFARRESDGAALERDDTAGGGGLRWDNRLALHVCW